MHGRGCACGLGPQEAGGGGRSTTNQQTAVKVSSVGGGAGKDGVTGEWRADRVTSL